MQRFPGWLRIVLLLAWTLLAQPALAHLVCIVSSDKSAAFQEAIDSVTQELVRSSVARQDIQVLTAAEFTDPASHSDDSRLIITLGTDAFRQITAQNGRIPVLAALIPRISFERVLSESNHKPPAAVAALYLDQPFSRQLDLLRMALPQMRHVGVLWGPESISQQPLLAAAMQGRGWDLVEGMYTEGQPLIGPLRTALTGADVLLAIADGNVYNQSSVSNILLTSYRAKTPVMAFSPAYVKAGALMAVHTTAAQAGARIAAMANHFLQTNSLPASQYPNDFSISVNDYVARSLGLTLDARELTERLRRMEKRP